MSAGTVTPALRDLDEQDRNVLFDRLQRRMPQIWGGMQHADPMESVVVLPSMSLDRVVAGQPSITQAMEERFLFMLLLLRQPRLRMIYITSVPINPAIIEYYLSLLPGVIPSHARARLSLVSVRDAGPDALTEKVLRRPRVLAEIAALIPDRTKCHLVPYNTTAIERDLCLQLGIPMFAADPRLFPLGTKTGCRQVFREAGVNFPAGAEDLASEDDVVAALAGLRRARPEAQSAMVKLNEGVSGSGNAVVDLTLLPDSGTDAEDYALRDRLRSMVLEDGRIDIGRFLAKLGERHGIVEERIVGDDIRSPSVQLRVTPLGELEVLSTHDQVLGGPSGQSYLGARFPADPQYATVISAEAERIGTVLLANGVLGRFAIDFVVVRDGPGWRSYAIEINLRKGGTTHPFLTLQFLTDGRYDAQTARFITPAGSERHLVATDHLEDHRLRGLRVEDLFDLLARKGMHFNQSTQTGVVFHMISAITESGRVGMTAIGETAEGAQQTFVDAQRALLEEADAALVDRPLPADGYQLRLR